MTDIKPCPFCGSTLVQIVVDGYCAWIICDNCNAEGPTASVDDYDHDEIEDQSANKWNNRVKDGQ